MEYCKWLGGTPSGPKRPIFHYFRLSCNHQAARHPSIPVAQGVEIASIGQVFAIEGEFIDTGIQLNRLRMHPLSDQVKHLKGIFTWNQ